MTAPAAPDARHPPGTLVLVVGPSGAGKDAVMAAARARLPADAPIRFATRTITRPAPAGGEAHRPIDAAGFRRLVETGGFALHWAAHGLQYGLPVEIEAWLAEGAVVVANASRGVLGAARARFPGLRVLHVTAPPDLLARRLAARGRESETEIAARLARAADKPPAGPDVVTIANDGALEEAAEAVAALLRALTRPAESGGAA
ncbi:MAG: phosphonate metabolism protein/1,5-bisphosphokinase (PRPP-forming) PhnN [Alphaproteobacteria bacterium]|nr:phosphonate metabolism protein/1,5-bisphosphokinase (PRPP-forming) PhnN [Alphaproteobacteria bacterium]